MERNNTLISDLTESSINVEVWAKILRVWETKTAPNEIERHLIVSDPNIFRRFEVTPCDSLIRNTPHEFQIKFSERTQVFFGYSLSENPMFVHVPFRQVLQMNFDNRYPIDLLGWVTKFGTLKESEDDPYEEIFGEPITHISFTLKDESVCELECKASGELARELDMKSWMIMKYEKTFLALRFWRVNCIEQGRVMITGGGPCATFEFDPTWI
ncbi:uncharacterized protein LOC125587779 [Brassica napus]|uniref:uncharacterized protein LOC125587779 n=1 Tax=Brassica napus TaxID=3708 RepID=UPI002079E5E2|nr:uncharacterized protein LOC125587779 [Brassica napus]